MIFRKKKVVTRSPNLSGGENQVYSYRSARNDNERQFDRSKDADRPQRRPRENSGVRKLLRFLSICVVLIGIIFFCSYVKAINRLVIEGGSNTTKQQKYSDNISDQLALSPLNKNFWLINQDKMTDNLKKSFPEVQKVTYNYSIISQKIDVTVLVSQPVVVISSSGNNFLIDSAGRVIEENYSRGDIPVVIDGDNRQYKKGDLALITNNLNYIHNILEQSKARDLTPEKISVEHGATEMYVKYTGDNYFAKFSLQNDPRISFGTFIVAREKSGEKPTEYIDVRVPDRAYLK